MIHVAFLEFEVYIFLYIRIYFFVHTYIFSTLILNARNGSISYITC